MIQVKGFLLLPCWSRTNQTTSVRSSPDSSGYSNNRYCRESFDQKRLNLSTYNLGPSLKINKLKSLNSFSFSTVRRESALILCWLPIDVSNHFLSQEFERRQCTGPFDRSSNQQPTDPQTKFKVHRSKSVEKLFLPCPSRMHEKFLFSSKQQSIQVHLYCTKVSMVAAD